MFPWTFSSGLGKMAALVAARIGPFPKACSSAATTWKLRSRKRRRRRRKRRRRLKDKVEEEHRGEHKL